MTRLLEALRAVSWRIWGASRIDRNAPKHCWLISPPKPRRASRRLFARPGQGADRAGALKHRASNNYLIIWIRTGVFRGRALRRRGARWWRGQREIRKKARRHCSGGALLCLSQPQWLQQIDRGRSDPEGASSFAWQPSKVSPVRGSGAPGRWHSEGRCAGLRRRGDRDGGSTSS